MGPPHSFPEITAVRPSWQRKTEEKEGGGENAEVKADTTDGGEGLHGMLTSREEGLRGILHTGSEDLGNSIVMATKTEGTKAPRLAYRRSRRMKGYASGKAKTTSRRMYGPSEPARGDPWTKQRVEYEDTEAED